MFDIFWEWFSRIYWSLGGKGVGKVMAMTMKQKVKIALPETLEIYEVHREHEQLVQSVGAAAVIALFFGLCAACYALLLTTSSSLVIVGGGMAFGALVILGVIGGFYLPTLNPGPLDLSDARFYTVVLPKGHQWQPEQAYQLMQQLVTTFGRLTFRIVAENGRIFWQILDLRLGTDPQVMDGFIRAAYPQADVQISPYQPQPTRSAFWRQVICFRQAELFPAPITLVEDLKHFDPLTTLTQAASQLLNGESMVYTLCICGPAQWANEQGQKLITTTRDWFTGVEGFQAAYEQEIRKATGANKEAVYVTELQRVMEDKLRQPLYQAVLLLEVNAPTSDRVATLASKATHVGQFARPSFNTLVAANDREKAIHVTSSDKDWESSSFGLLSAWFTNEDKAWKQVLLVLDINELAALWHLPHEGFSASGIVRLRSKQVPLPDQIIHNRDGVYLGESTFAGRHYPVYLRNEDRITHMAVIGMTGTGKSNFLHSLIAQDIFEGRGVCVIDPLGKLVSNILRFSIPPEREADVVVLDVANQDYPAPFNMMTLPVSGGVELASNQVLSILAKMFPNMSGTRWADTLAMALLTLHAEDTATFRDVSKLLSDTAYRDRLLERIDNEAIHDFWQDFDRKSAGMQDELTDPIKHRLRAFYGNSYFYPISCHPQGLNFSTMLEEGKIILVSLGVDETKITAYERRLLGAFIISQIQMAAVSHACEKNGFYLFVDEAQEFITTSLKTMLTQARQFNLSLTLANQYLGQLVGDTLEAVRGDVGAFVFFQLGDEDAGIAARYTRPNFEAEDLMTLEKYQAIVRMRLGTTTLPAFSLQTRLACDEQVSEERLATEARIRARSVEQYTPMSREAVLEWLGKRYPRKARGSDEQQDEFSDPV